MTNELFLQFENFSRRSGFVPGEPVYSHYVIYDSCYVMQISVLFAYVIYSLI